MKNKNTTLQEDLQKQMIRCIEVTNLEIRENVNIFHVKNKDDMTLIAEGAFVFMLLNKKTNNYYVFDNQGGIFHYEEQI